MHGARPFNELLTGPDGQIPSQLASVATLLLDDNDPELTLEILNGSQWIQLAAVPGGLAVESGPAGQETLDPFPVGVRDRVPVSPHRRPSVA
jgi:hypothetical protein